MQNSRICVIYSYPSLSSAHGSKLLQAVKKALGEGKIQFTLIDLYGEKFNPVMSEREVEQYGKSPSPEIIRYQSILGEADAWIILYPVWWSIPPAILKGFFDRVLTQGFAFDFSEKGATSLLKGKRALVIRTFSSSAAQEQKVGNLAKNFMEKAILGFCGIKSNSIDIYSVNSLPETAFHHSLIHVEGAVRRILAKPTEVPHHLRSIPAPHLPPVEDKGDSLKALREEKEKKLSKSAKDDLEYFRNARRRARRTVHKRSDKNEATRYMFADDDSDFHPKYVGYTGRQPHKKHPHKKQRKGKKHFHQRHKHSGGRGRRR
ncbi:MAG: NAD(P)H-dependent oxidoreductase [Candidatus Micrarchaeota archaeon]